MYPCHIWSIEDAGKAYAEFQGELIRDYGDTVRLRDGRVLHWNHAWDEGGRSLVRCAKCGGLILMQKSEYHNMYDGPDGYYRDWIPVATAEEGDLKNILLNEGELEFDPCRHLRGNNRTFFWTGGGEPKPDGPEDLKRQILMKYPIRSLEEIAGAEEGPFTG